MTVLTSDENLKIGQIASQLSYYGNIVHWVFFIQCNFRFEHKTNYTFYFFQIPIWINRYSTYNILTLFSCKRKWTRQPVFSLPFTLSIVNITHIKLKKYTQNIPILYRIYTENIPILYFCSTFKQRKHSGRALRHKKKTGFRKIRNLNF